MMTSEQKKFLKAEINKAITHITRGSGFYKDEIEELVREIYKK